MPEETQAGHTGRMADDGSGQVDTESNIAANIAAEFGTLGTVVSDEMSLPVDSSFRPSGRFTDAHDAETYLESGGLVLRDDLGNTIPFPWVYWLKTFDEILEEDVYQVYIRETSD
jgi:hypothetical protein